MKTLSLIQQIAGLRNTLQVFARRFTHDREECHDLVQDTMLKALMHHDKFKEETNLKGWLFTIMRNTFINNYRKTKRDQNLPNTINEFYLLNVEDTYTFNSPGHAYEYKDIWKNIDELKEELHTPFKLYTSGYKYNEIADLLKIPIGTVKNRIFHARRYIQKKLAGY